MERYSRSIGIILVRAYTHSCKMAVSSEQFTFINHTFVRAYDAKCEIRAFHFELQSPSHFELQSYPLLCIHFWVERMSNANLIKYSF